MKFAGRRLVVALAAAFVTVPSAAMAQQATAAVPAGQAKPATSKPAAPKPTTVRPLAKHTPKPQEAAAGEAPILLGQYGEWGAYRAVSSANKICFVLAKPVSAQTNPANRPRNQAFFLVASRPAENVRNEVSVIAGYGYKPGSDANVEVGTDNFAMNTQSDGAWIKNVAEEARLVEIMRKGSDLVVTGTSSHGTQSTDRYSLKGLGQALDRAGQECNK